MSQQETGLNCHALENQASYTWSRECVYDSKNFILTSTFFLGYNVLTVLELTFSSLIQSKIQEDPEQLCLPWLKCEKQDKINNHFCIKIFKTNVIFCYYHKCCNKMVFQEIFLCSNYCFFMHFYLMHSFVVCKFNGH